MSRVHARFDIKGDTCVVTDNGSTNGTLLNNEPITVAPVQDDDVVVLGGLSVKVEQSAADRLTFSEHHTFVESQVTVSRNVAKPDQGVEAVGAVADAKRLLRLMSDVAGTLVRSQPLSEVLSRVVDLTFDTILAERAFLILLEPGTGALIPRVVRNRGASNPGSTSISRTIVNRVLADRVAILADDAQTDPNFQSAQSIFMQALRSFMCAPLWNQNDVIGILYVDTPRSRRFTAADLDLFTALSNYAAVAIDQARLGARLLEETRRRERLQRYHSPGIVSRILEGVCDGDAPFIAQERDLTVVFVDIVGFTALAEGLAPGQVAKLLNTYLGTMSDVIFEHEGTLDKFIGDAIMAVFGAPLEQPDHALRAVRAAQQMRGTLARLNEQCPCPIRMRTAIHSGTALAGDMGSPKRREYTVLGDVVNIASRLEKLAGPGEIIISGATFERLDNLVPARSRGRVQLRGRVAEVDIFEVVG